MTRRLVFLPASVRTLSRLGVPEAKRVTTALELFADTGRGDVKALKGDLKGHYRLRVGKWRAVFRIDEAGCIVVVGVDNRGQVY